MDESESIEALLERAERGDAAARDAVFAALYTELHRLARSQLRRGGGNELTLSTTTLLHEAYVDLSRRSARAFPDKARFLAYASRAMRGLIVDHVRRRTADKRGGGRTFAGLDEDQVAIAADAEEIEPIGAALEELAALEPSLAELVDLKFFCGFSLGEIAALRDVSERTVQRDWAKARLLLRRMIDAARGD